MKKNLSETARRFLSILSEHEGEALEHTLQKSYELGRTSLSEGMGVLDLTQAYQEAVEEFMAGLPADERWRFLPAAQKVLRESLSSFELAQAGLKDVVDSLKISNQALENEILERKKVEKEVLEISQKEQRRFGAELHDGLCQKLVGISMLLRSLVRNDRSEGLPYLAELKNIAKLVDDAAKQARDMAHGLFPVDLQADALMVSLKSFADRVAKSYGISCEFHCPEAILIEDNNVATHLFRIAQEATNNSLKHGKAGHIEIELRRWEGRIWLIVRDDGNKSPGKPVEPGIGIQIMKYRARMIDASLEFGDREPHGSELVCTFSG